MTNRSRQGSAPAGGSRGNSASHKHMKFLDLSFEGREQARVNSLSNGFRPHGGYRGVSKHPPGLHSFNKSSDYQRQIQEDLDKLFEEEKYSRCSSPGWALDASKEHNHSGESPLFVHKLLAPSRIDQQFNPSTHHRSLQHHRIPKAPSQVNGISYYRPNRTHQYLTKTELKDSTSSEVEPKLGKPTRTTLLRARQRCNSAPINSYEARRELQRKLEMKDELRRTKPPSLTIGDLLDASVPEGESLHSFLIGARYNRAHYLDSKSLFEYGVYMPRNNPMGCFVIRKNTPEYAESDTPGPPPDSPASAFSDDDEEGEDHERQCAKSPIAPPQPPSTPSKLQKQAWDDASKVEVSIAPEDAASNVEPAEEREKKSTAHGHMPVMEQIMNLDDGYLLNVKGKSLNNSRPRSAHPVGNQPMPYTQARPTSACPNLPAVSIQGRSLSRLPKPSQKDQAIDQTLLANNPQLSNVQPLLSPNPPEKTLTVPPQSPVPSQELQDAERNPLADRETQNTKPIESEEDVKQLDTSAENNKEDPAKSKPRIVKVDKAINCPSVPSTIGEPVVNDEEKTTPELKTDNVPNNDEGEREESWPSGEEKVEVEKKVRFADELDDDQKKSEGKVVFFMTENDGNKEGTIADRLNRPTVEESREGNIEEGTNSNGVYTKSNSFVENEMATSLPEGRGDNQQLVNNIVISSGMDQPCPIVDGDNITPEISLDTGKANANGSGDIIKDANELSERTFDSKSNEKGTDFTENINNTAEENEETIVQGDQDDNVSIDTEEEKSQPVISIDISPKPSSPTPSNEPTDT